MEIHHRRARGPRRVHRPPVRQEEGRIHLTAATGSFAVRIEPGGHVLRVAAGENLLAAALAAGIPLPHSCRAGRCASCKAKLISGRIGYPGDQLPPGIVTAEAARGEVLLCQAQPRSDLEIATRTTGTRDAVSGVVVEDVAPLSTGGRRVTLRFLGVAPAARPGQFLDVETAAGDRERVPVVAVASGRADVELLELPPESLVRARGPFDAPR